MGTEYYIIKPKTKEKFYLGRRISYLEGIPSWNHTQKADYCEWEYWEDVVFDLQENSRYFLEGEQYTIGQIWDFCYKIHDFCDSEVYLDNDCSDNYDNWSNYKEIDYISDMLSVEEKWCELINLIPSQEWITEDKIVNEFETVKNYLIKLKGGNNDKG